jgi:hypothetical protein
LAYGVAATAKPPAVEKMAARMAAFIVFFISVPPRFESFVTGSIGELVHFI